MRQKAEYEDRILVMGIGNYLMGDEGVGVHLAQCLSALNLPPNVDVLDGGTSGFHLLEYFEEYPQVILVDATLDNNPPGTIRLIKPKFADDFPQAMSTHDIGLKDMIGALHLLDRAPEIHLLVVSIASLQQQGTGLTEEIEAIMPLLFEKVTEMIGGITERTLEWATP
ncbi:MAG: hydrogenase maturation protease [Chitinophagaceae bacterium]|nr:hydrogenase maturation protease [Chitinophagaceae bacterium]